MVLQTMPAFIPMSYSCSPLGRQSLDEYKGMPEVYAAKEDVLEWTWLLYCVPVKEGRLLKGWVRAAAASTQHCSWGVETHQTFCTLGQSRGANRNIRAHVLASELWGLERHNPLRNMPVFCWGTTWNSCIHWDGVYQSGKNGASQHRARGRVFSSCQGGI